MQADVILKEPPSWVPPLSLSGGGTRRGGRGPGPPSYAPGLNGEKCSRFPYVNELKNGNKLQFVNIINSLHGSQALRGNLVF